MRNLIEKDYKVNYGAVWNFLCTFPIVGCIFIATWYFTILATLIAIIEISAFFQYLQGNGWIDSPSRYSIEPMMTFSLVIATIVSLYVFVKSFNYLFGVLEKMESGSRQ